jgi:sorting nexin-8
MSLFGDEDVPVRAKQSSSLFDDDAKPAKTGNSLFADEIDNNESPWGLPTPKKAGRGSLVKSLLPASDVPDAYIDAFDAVLDAGDRAGSGISIEGAKKLLSDSGVSGDDQSKMLEIVAQPGQESAGLGRNEFNVLFALIGLAQENEDITLDSVDERKRSAWKPCTVIICRAPLTARQICPCPP